MSKLNSKRQPQPAGINLPGWLPLLIGMTLAARADETRSEQEAFDRYFRLPAATPTRNWNSHFSLGAMVGFNIKASFNESGMFNLAGNNAANGIYDNGFVLPDPDGDPNYTRVWGYQKSQQYDPVARTLTMQATTSYQITGEGNSGGDRGPFPGFELDYGGNLYQWQNFRVGWDLGFGLLPNNISDNQTLNASINQNTYTYDTSGLYVFPGPGVYQYQSGYLSRGAQLPTSLKNPPTQMTESGSISGTRSLDSILYAIRLGPTFYWDFADNWSLSLGAGPALGIVSAEYKYDEVVVSPTSNTINHGRFNGTDVVYGGDVNVRLCYHTSDKARPVDLYIGAQYMPLGNADFNQGGRNARLDLSGQVYLSAGVNWPF